jgi:hypothetical protein
MKFFTNHYSQITIRICCMSGYAFSSFRCQSDVTIRIAHCIFLSFDNYSADAQQHIINFLKFHLY